MEQALRDQIQENHELNAYITQLKQGSDKGSMVDDQNQTIRRLTEEKNQLLDYVEETVEIQEKSDQTIKDLEELNQNLRRELEAVQGPSGDLSNQRLESELEQAKTQLSIEKTKHDSELKRLRQESESLKEENEKMY